MDEQKIVSAADDLFDALVNCHTIPPLRGKYPDIDMDSAYRISLNQLARRLARGEKIIGKKIGVTSQAGPGI